MSYPRLSTNETSFARFARNAATAINYLLGRDEPREGQVRYEAGQLEYFDGTTWQAVP